MAADLPPTVTETPEADVAALVVVDADHEDRAAHGCHGERHDRDEPLLDVAADVHLGDVFDDEEG